MSILEGTGIKLDRGELEEFVDNARQALIAFFGTNDTIKMARNWRANPRPSKFKLYEFMHSDNPAVLLDDQFRDIFLTLPLLSKKDMPPIEVDAVYGPKLAALYRQLTGIAQPEAATEKSSKTVEAEAEPETRTETAETAPPVEPPSAEASAEIPPTALPPEAEAKSTSDAITPAEEAPTSAAQPQIDKALIHRLVGETIVSFVEEFGDLIQSGKHVEQLKKIADPLMRIVRAERADNLALIKDAVREAAANIASGNAELATKVIDAVSEAFAEIAKSNTELSENIRKAVLETVGEVARRDDADITAVTKTLDEFLPKLEDALTAGKAAQTLADVAAKTAADAARAVVDTRESVTGLTANVEAQAASIAELIAAFKENTAMLQRLDTKIDALAAKQDQTAETISALRQTVTEGFAKAADRSRRNRLAAAILLQGGDIGNPAQLLPVSTSDTAPATEATATESAEPEILEEAEEPSNITEQPVDEPAGALAHFASQPNFLKPDAIGDSMYSTFVEAQRAYDSDVPHGVVSNLRKFLELFLRQTLAAFADNKDFINRANITSNRRQLIREVLREYRDAFDAVEKRKDQSHLQTGSMAGWFRRLIGNFASFDALNFPIELNTALNEILASQPALYVQKTPINTPTSRQLMASALILANWFDARFDNKLKIRLSAINPVIETAFAEAQRKAASIVDDGSERFPQAEKEDGQDAEPDQEKMEVIAETSVDAGAPTSAAPQAAGSASDAEPETRDAPEAMPETTDQSSVPAKAAANVKTIDDLTRLSTDFRPLFDGLKKAGFVYRRDLVDALAGKLPNIRRTTVDTRLWEITSKTGPKHLLRHQGGEFVPTDFALALVELAQLPEDQPATIIFANLIEAEKNARAVPPVENRQSESPQAPATEEPPARHAKGKENETIEDAAPAAAPSQAVSSQQAFLTNDDGVPDALKAAGAELVEPAAHGEVNGKVNGFDAAANTATKPSSALSQAEKSEETPAWVEMCLDAAAAHETLFTPKKDLSFDESCNDPDYAIRIAQGIETIGNKIMDIQRAMKDEYQRAVSRRSHKDEREALLLLVKVKIPETQHEQLQELLSHYAFAVMSVPTLAFAKNQDIGAEGFGNVLASLASGMKKIVKIPDMYAKTIGAWRQVSQLKRGRTGGHGLSSLLMALLPQ